jgi:glutathionylspermidine amidase/synthetase
MNRPETVPHDHPAPFGAVLGIAPGEVPAFSSDYETADDRLLPNRHAYRSYLDGVYMGYKWQCVEFARRWLYVNRGYIFDDVAMAYEIFRLRSVRVVKDDRLLPLRSFRNGAQRHPEPGCLMVWSEGGEFERTGHVAVVTEVFADRIRLAEQNVGHRVWAPGCDYSREIPARITEDGAYWVRCSFSDASILGWVIQTDDDTHAEPLTELDPRVFNLVPGRVPARGRERATWLNVANPDEAAYVAMMGGHKLASDAVDPHLYYRMSEAAESELKRATDELHALFMHATDYVLQDDTLLERFNIPRAIWPKIHQSWDNRRNQLITGRFDFSLSERGLKVYEYNCDSASCHMECGKVQGKWAQHFGCDDGRDPGERLHRMLVRAWEDSDVDGVLHILLDPNPEETYHALFMREALDRAGVRTKVIDSFDGLTWNADGEIVDADGDSIRWVWKTWAWETALDQIRAECEDDQERLRTYRAGERRTGTPRLVDVLLRPEVMVYEPLWTLIPSNKAILPILWELFPNHPYLLNSAYELADELRQKGYVVKPIVGRAGSNIRMIDRDAGLIEATTGQFERQQAMFQELFRLPVVAGYHVQLTTFSAAAKYAGSAVRIGKTPLITGDSDLVALRVVEDRDVLDALEEAERLRDAEAGYQI